MIFVNILLFLITLPFRLIGTIVGGTLRVIGKFITFVTDVTGVVLKAIGIILILIFALGILMCTFNFHGMGELPNWQFFAFTGLGFSIVIFLLANFGYWLGEKLDDWGDDLILFSWQMIIL